MMNHEAIKSIYQRYGFKEFQTSIENGYISFLYVSGPFKNIEIIKTRPDANTSTLEKELKKCGYAHSILEPGSEIESRLFDSFFSVDSYREKIKNEYISFTTSICKKYSDSSTYEYLVAPYFIDGKKGETNISEEILSRIDDTKPIIFVVEAAAGFGKTCSAYELASKINSMHGKIPLLAELSKNRQARIFRHVLLDEIDKSFINVSSSLVKSEMENGKIITILDGFDELLKDNLDEEQDFESKEPMLETIGEYLTGNAKIILTTRRTMLFDGDGFHSWAEKNKSAFSLVKIQINEPEVTDWISSERRVKLEDAGIEISSIANPVMLSFLRHISEDEMMAACREPDKLVENYFNFILDREQNRQDLKMTSDEQNLILDIVAKDMIDKNYRSEDRNYIIDLIKIDGYDLIQTCIERYDPNNKPTHDEMANKLASHAFLDRSSRNPTKIEFINEFVFGHYVTRDIYNRDGWICDDWRYIGPAISSFRTRLKEKRKELWIKLKDSLDYISCTNKVSASIELLQEVSFEILNNEINSLTFHNIEIGTKPIRNSHFNDCQFNNCIIDPSKISDVTFFSCRFYNCKIRERKNFSGFIYTPGSVSDNDILEQLKLSRQEKEAETIKECIIDRAEKAVLERFWPVGRETITHKHRPIKGICAYSDSGNISPDKMFAAIISLKKKQILNDGRYSGFVEINLSEIIEIKRILGRDE
ncbi:hypothetical protein [Pseudaeromonas paramecii]|uniref:NACHT-associated inactive Restriction Endonuclease 2 domain-containing protein n=1 Tax=Pseudaeromonas paramecii TaxID=2138166 RepID=A0ABP8QJR1_9GAMM